MEVNGTYCLNHSSKDYFILDTTSNASSSVGVLSSLAAIILLLVSKGYKEFIHRLFLYLSTAALVVCAVQMLFNITFDYMESQFWLVRFIYFMLGYSGWTYCLILCWISFYVFWLAMYHVQLKKPKHEVTGLVIVLASPSTVSWVTLWQLQSSCLKATSMIITTCANYLPALVFMLFTFILIVAILFILCRGARLRAANRNLYKKAVKETVPIVIFVIAHQVIVTIALVYATYLSVIKSVSEGENGTSLFVLQELYELYPLLPVTILMLLLWQTHFRCKANCCRRKSIRQTQHNIYTEEDPLLNV